MILSSFQFNIRGEGNLAFISLKSHPIINRVLTIRGCYELNDRIFCELDYQVQNLYKVCCESVFS